MDSFYKEVVKEIKKPKNFNNNLNNKLLRNLEEQGCEVKRFLMKNTNIGAAIQNPIVKLYRNKTLLTNEEFCAALNYQRSLELADKTNHSKPSYDGTAISSGSNKVTDRSPGDMQIRASKFIYDIELKIRKEDPKLKLRQILHLIFEKQRSVRFTEGLIGLNHKTIEKRIKAICKILLDS